MRARHAVARLRLSWGDGGGVLAPREKGGVVLVAAVKENGRFNAADLIDQSAKAVQGGFGRKGNPSLIVAGGKNVEGIDEALELARSAAGI